MKLSVILSLIIIFAVPAGAIINQVEGPQAALIYNFNQWKQQQVTEAENKVVRLSNRIQVLKSDYVKLDEANYASPELKSWEEKLKSASEDLEITQEFDKEDYYAVYIPQLRGDHESLKKLLKRMSGDEAAELLNHLIQPKKAQKNQSAFNSNTNQKNIF